MLVVGAVLGFVGLKTSPRAEIALATATLQQDAPLLKEPRPDAHAVLPLRKE